ncbi:MAG: serine hydrolase [Prochlorococcus sp.]|nr:serine hydrolase [Prochlorococcus sp.]
MAFYRLDTTMQAQLAGLLDRLAADGRPGLQNNVAISWIRYDQANPVTGSGSGAGWSDLRPIYPASVVKLIYAVAVEAWLQRDLLPEGDELRRAVQDMIVGSSNDATGLVIDLLTGTTGGPSLKGEYWQAWQQQRQLVNHWLQGLGWAEMNRVNCCQKTWGDGPYGRERDFYGIDNDNRNALTTAGTARMFEAVMTDALVSPLACKRLRQLLSRSLDVAQRQADPENQIDGFLGEGLPAGTLLWSKAGWMSQARHDAAWWCKAGGAPMLLVVFTHGRERADDLTLLPALARELCKL